MDTQGMLGPGMMMGPGMGDMGMMMSGVFPMNAMAGQQTTYFVDIPTTKVIPPGGKIKITLWDTVAESIKNYKVEEIIEIVGGYTRQGLNNSLEVV